MTRIGRLARSTFDLFGILKGIVDANPAQQEEASRRRAQYATLQELAHSYNLDISTIGGARCPAW
jgi:hypothetical protein